MDINPSTPKVTSWNGRSDAGILTNPECTQRCLHVNILHPAGPQKMRVLPQPGGA